MLQYLRAPYLLILIPLARCSTFAGGVQHVICAVCTVSIAKTIPQLFRVLGAISRCWPCPEKLVSYFQNFDGCDKQGGALCMLYTVCSSQIFFLSTCNRDLRMAFWCRFLAGDDESANSRRNSIFKLIPSVVKGSWVIKQSVGHTPVLLGKKLKTQYHR